MGDIYTVPIDKTFRGLYLNRGFAAGYVNPKVRHWAAIIVGFDPRYTLAREFLPRAFIPGKRFDVGYLVARFQPEVSWLVKKGDILEEAGGSWKNQFRAYVKVLDIKEEEATLEEMPFQDVVDWARSVGEVLPSLKSRIMSLRLGIL